MEIITADWESYYDKDYSLSKITTEEYVRSDKFQAIMLGLKMPDGSHRVITGTHKDIQYQLDAIDWGKYAILCHNTLFDGAIFSWRFNVKPKVWLDTLSMGRAMFGNKGNSLKALATYYGLEEKGTYVANMMGRSRESMSPAEFKLYSEYCLHDCDLTLDIFNLMSQGWYNLGDVDKRDPFEVKELRLIDSTIRMFTEPVLRLDHDRLVKHLQVVKDRKEELLGKSGVSKDILMSNPKFAELLLSLGVVPPMKTSPTTGKEAFAFAKTDEAMKNLLEHPNIDVQAVVAARMGVKSTIEETRTERFISISTRGLFPIPLRYCAAHTKRWGGTDKINMQNLPARGVNAGHIKHTILPPEGYVIIDCDSSNIEARGLGWLAEQDDLTEDFRNKVDVYIKMAEAIYLRILNKNDNPLERFVGKTIVLGAGYGTGGTKLQATLKAANPPVDLHVDECNAIIKTYRATYPMIVALWRQADKAIQAMHDDQSMWLGKEGVLFIDGKRGIRLPNGLYLTYSQLHRVVDEETGKLQWLYKGDYGQARLYGAKLIENVCQALARIVIGEQLLRAAKKYKVVMTVHDAIAIVARKNEALEAQAFLEECMQWVTAWATGWPLSCESGIGNTYGEC